MKLQNDLKGYETNESNLFVPPNAHQGHECVILSELPSTMISSNYSLYFYNGKDTAFNCFIDDLMLVGFILTKYNETSPSSLNFNKKYWFSI